MHLLTLLLLVAGGMLAFKWLKGQPGHVRKTAGLKIALAAVGILVLLGVLAGRLNPMTLVVTALAAIPMLGRLLDAKQLFDRLRRSDDPSTSAYASGTTEFLEIRQQKSGGPLTGTVRRGRFEGRALSELNSDQLLELLRECSADPKSAALLESYLDQRLGGGWRDTVGGVRGRRSHMSQEQARQILGVDTDATREEIVAAHRSLMQKLHPDRGGSTYLAAQINQAKDVLLARL